MERFPISKYIGQYPNGKWEFVKWVDGTYDDTMKEVKILQKENLDYQYRIWDENSGEDNVRV